jgi:DNA-directed RNA polymerase specialized sigma24 family protein
MVIWSMPMSSDPPSAAAFAAFVRDVEPGLRQALVATYGSTDGREATIDALSWAWEHWGRLDGVATPIAYLYRVGQTATRRFATRHLPLLADAVSGVELREIEPGLVPALSRLSGQQRTVVLLVCAFGWRHTEVADLLGISPPTVRTHLGRALDRLRDELEARDVG